MNEKQISALIIMDYIKSLDSIRLINNFSVFCKFNDMGIKNREFWRILDQLVVMGYCSVNRENPPHGQKWPEYSITDAGHKELGAIQWNQTFNWHYDTWNHHAPLPEELKAIRKALTPAQRRILMECPTLSHVRINNVRTRQKLVKLGLFQHCLEPDFRLMKLTRRGVIVSEMLEKDGYWTNKNALMYFHEYRMIKISGS